MGKIFVRGELRAIHVKNGMEFVNINGFNMPVMDVVPERM